MALVAAGIANGGVIMKPHILAQVANSQGQVVRTYQPSPWLTATSAQTAAQMTQLMTAVVQSGTGTAARIPGIDVAGKTGTAQTGNNTIHAWFVCFAPRHPAQGGGGGVGREPTRGRRGNRRGHRGTDRQGRAASGSAGSLGPRCERL